MVGVIKFCGFMLIVIKFCGFMLIVIKFCGFMLNVIMLSVILHKANMLNGMLSLFKVSLWCVSLCKMPWLYLEHFPFVKKLTEMKKLEKVPLRNESD